MEMLTANDVTGLLIEWGQGDKAALDRLTPLVYDEIRRIAHRYKLDFGRKFVECDDARAVKSDLAFIRLREEVLHVIHSSPQAQAA